ncbi:MAG TPA: VCBS repeat-containing protein [Myxococcota bacterium]|nr:VCBS repeat-containing protein [Myxococcota bacterium]
MNRKLALAGLVAVALGVAACSGDAPKGKPKSEKVEKVEGKKAKKPEEAPVEIAGPAPALIVGQAHFGKEDGKPKPLPAKIVILRYKDGKWGREEFLDGDSNVFHKAIAFGGGILTIGGEKAMVKQWTQVGGKWTAKTLYEKSWGGKFNRFRDLEVGDVTGDGKDDLVMATHDAGVIAVAQQGADGAWTFTEFDQRPDTFVHEIEIGDVDGDGKKEFYATPSERNRASGESQPGSVWRYDFDGTTFKHTAVVDFTESHAKEILVTDTDGDGRSELYVVREAHTVKEGDVTKRVDPVRIVRYDRSGDTWTGTDVATLDDDQCRFLVPGDVDGDGKVELVAAGFKSGLWVLEPSGDGKFTPSLIDKNSGGFEHATHVADLDGDGKVEIYVASDEQKEFRQYKWDGSKYAMTVIGPIGPSDESFITWNMQNGTL